MFHLVDSINIELTNKCNLNCKDCYRQNMTYKIGEIDTMLLDLILSKLRLFRGEVFLHWRGEPLLHSKISQVANLLSNFNYSYTLFTNLTTNVNILYEYPDLINKLYISLDAFHSESEKKLEYYENIIIDLKAKTNIKSIFINSVVDMNNIKYSFILQKSFQKLVSGIFFRKSTHLSAINRKQQINAKCKLAYPHTLFISWDGNIFPCCMDINGKYPLGNILSKEPFIFNDKINDLCSKCEISAINTRNIFD